MMNYLMMPSVQQESQAQICRFDRGRQPHILRPSEISNESPNLQSSIEISLDDGFPATDESNQWESPFTNSEVDEDEEHLNTVLIDSMYSDDDQMQGESMFGNSEVDQNEETFNTLFFSGDQIQMQSGRASSLHTEDALTFERGRVQSNQTVLRESRQAQTNDTIHGVIPLNETKGKCNVVHASSAKPMAPQKTPTIDVRVAGRGAQNVMKRELAGTEIKQERARLYESSAKAKVRQAPQYTPLLFL